MSDTRWACRSDSIVAVSKNYSAIVKALDEIGEKSQVPKVVSDANALKHLVQQFEFLLCLDVLEDVLLKCRRVSDYLQRDDIDMITALNMVDTTLKVLEGMRSSEKFNILFCKAMNKCEAEIVMPRTRRVSSRADANWQNEHSFDSLEAQLRVKFYFDVLDIMIAAFHTRFNQECRPYLTLLGKLQNRQSVQETDLDTVGTHFSLDTQLLKVDWDLFINDSDLTEKSPYKIIKEISEKRSRCYPELELFLIGLCTIPFSSASCERVFSKMSIVKSKLRTTMTEDRLRSLLLAYVEQETLSTVKKEDVLKEFVKIGRRRLDFGQITD